MGEYIAVRVEDDETVESMFDLYHSHVSIVQLYLEKEDIDNISIQGNDEVQTHGHIDDNLHTQHYEYQQPTGHFTRMLNDDVDSTGFYFANKRDVRSIGYGGGSLQYPFMPITDPSHTFHSASSSGYMWHRRTDYIIPPDEESVGIGRVEYMAWYWSITRQYIGRPGFTYDMRYESRDHIERSLVEGMKHLHMMATDGLQDDISDSTQSLFIAIQMYIDGVLSHVQRTDSSTSHVGPSEPCADTPQQPDDAGPSHCSPDVMTVS
ncbi:hypothetical protein Taro_028058 [Colocasia esculenta]|uniref:Uncharacterized protein n=1 Tax=Colocasia esculenta TaxID=4460 RepID=A0A843VT46_COLES|nr:hypothetical protein [Colocasia esculenta]